MNLLLQSMLEAHPQGAGVNMAIVVDALELLATCEQVCAACGDACLSEENPEHLRDCIRQNVNCSAVCSATARVLLRYHAPTTAVLHAQLHACVLACQACADACAAHAENHEHCAICAETCRRCQEKCNLALAEVSPAGVAASE